MHRFLKTVLVCGLLLGTAGSSFANSGSAVLPFFRVSGNSTRIIESSWYVSNVTSRDVQVTLALFDQQGDPIGAGTFTATVIAAGGFISCNGTNTVCTLPAGKSGFFKASPPAGTTDWFGHGTLEWSISGTDSQPVSLTTTGVMTINSLVGANQILFPLEVTKSQPF